MASWWFISSAHAVTPVVLVGPDLEPQPASLHSLRDGELTYFDAQRTLRTAKLERFLQVRLPGRDKAVGEAARMMAATQPATRPAEALAVLELTDGERLIGRVLGATAQGQGLILEHRLLGRRQVRLDDMRLLAMQRGPGAEGEPAAAWGPAELPTTGDVLVLANGDRLEGVAVALGDGGVEFQPRGAAQAVVVPLERVAQLRLANPARKPADSAAGPATHLIHLRDGGVVRGAALTVEQERLRFEIRPGAGAAEERTVALAELRAIDVASSAGRLVRLAELPMKVTAGAQVFGLATPPRFDDGSLWLHAPVTVEFALPHGAQRFAAAVAPAGPMDQPRRVEAGPAEAWRDVILIVSIDGAEQWRQRLTGRAAPQGVNVRAAGRTLSIRLESAGNGPVMDRLFLHEAVVLVGR